jgi:hypothetical protein
MVQFNFKIEYTTSDNSLKYELFYICTLLKHTENFKQYKKYKNSLDKDKLYKQ